MVTIEKTRKKLKRKEVIQRNLWCWLFMSLTVLFYIVFQGWPIIASIYYSLLDWSGLTSNATFVGLGNYKALLQDQLFWNAFKNSFVYMALVVPLQLVVSLFLAYLLNDKLLRGKTAYRTAFFIPVITTTSIVGIIMVFIWGVQGPVNAMLTSTGILGKAVNFLGNGKTAMITAVLISVWKDCGIYMIYWLAGLQSVPEDVYEAATVDGASRSRIFFSIVLPLIAPIAGIISILCIINSLKVFDIIKTMTNGGPFFATDVIATYVYRLAFSSEIGLPRLGYASAAAILFGVVIIVVGGFLSLIRGMLEKRKSI